MGRGGLGLPLVLGKGEFTVYLSQQGRNRNFVTAPYREISNDATDYKDYVIIQKNAQTTCKQELVSATYLASVFLKFVDVESLPLAAW